VICDRYSDATYAYQSGGRGLDREKFAQIEAWVHPQLQPDLTLLFDLPVDLAARRIAAQARALDRFEVERQDFHHRVRLAYLERAAAAPERMRVIDTNQPPDVVAAHIRQVVLAYCA
jgi:dTMP kinase